LYAQYKEAWNDLIAPGADFEINTTSVRDVPIRTYANAAPNMRDVFMSSIQFADRDYLVYQDERLTYGQAHAQVQAIGAWLIEQGVKPGDRVAISMRNYPEWLLIYWATFCIGATVVGMNAWWTGPEIDYALDDSTPNVMVLDAERLARINNLADRMSQIIMVGVRLPEDIAGITPWQDVISHAGTIPALDIHPDDVACIFYTSGTTGNPKGAELTHRGCVSNIWSLMFSAALLRTLAERNGLIEPDAESPIGASLVTTPLFHVTANNCVAHGTTLGGGKLVHMYKWDAGEALALIEKEGITALTGVPVMAREVISHPNFAKTDTSTILSMGGGGAQLQPDLVGKIDEVVVNARPNTGYGMTETCGIITSIGGDFFVDKPDSCGPAMPCFETKVIDTEGREVARGETGELLVRGAHVISGYLNRPEATSEAIKDGWFHTGDIARIDEDDFIYIVDRLKDMVLRGGENIYCAEVESALFKFDDVAECSVFGIPDDRLGEEVGVAVYFKEGTAATAAELRDHLRELIASPKIPRYIWFTNAPLPRNASGKFLKRELRETLSLDDAQ